MIQLTCSDRDLKEVAGRVAAGGLVVYPTDTVYGLGCNPWDEKAVERVYELKQRLQKPLPVLCSSLAQVENLVEINEVARTVAARYWPGPVTIISRLRDQKFPNRVTLGSDTLGVRIPNHYCAIKLIELCGGCLIGTSANRSGLHPPKSANEALKVLGGGIDVLVDGGPTPLGIESTVVDATAESLNVVREGAIKSSEILKHAH